ncbi:MAG: tetratricopeptide repeat-containing protein [Gammaproteobacteria bacterium]
MVEKFDDVLALKASAKSARDDGDWEGAIVDLQEAVDLLRRRTPEPLTRLPSRLASELADAYGLIGGVQKRWGLLLRGGDRKRHLTESIAAYDQGFRYEEDLGPGDASTYNRINRLVGRVLLDPHVLQGDRGAAIDDELQKAEEILTEQLKSARRKDPWGYSDLGTIRLLRGAADALSAYNDLDRLRPPAFVYESALATLEPLSEAASDLRPGLIQAVAQLRRSARFTE